MHLSSQRFSRQTLHIKFKVNISAVQILGFFTTASVTLFLLQLTNIEVGFLNPVLFELVFVLGSGISILSLLKIKVTFSRIEYVALSFPLSMAYLALLGTFVLLLPASARGYTESLMVVILSFTALVIKIKTRTNENSQSKQFTLDNSSMILIAVLVFFAFIFVDLYPQISYFLSQDIVHNYTYALAFSQNSLGSFSNLGTNYPLFTVYQSSIFYAAHVSLETFQIFSVILGLFVILSFYAMASQYLKHYGKYTPAIATLIWSAFSGFGWLSFLSDKISHAQLSFMSLISQANVLSYGDITWRRLFFFLSMEASLSLVFGVLYLLKRKDIPRTNHFILMTLLIVPIPFMHPYATYTLLPILFCIAVVCRNSLRDELKSVGISMMVTSVSIIPLNYILGIFGLGSSSSFLTFGEYLVAGLVIIALTSFNRTISILHISSANSYVRGDLKRVVLLIVILLFFTSVLLWFNYGVSFNFSSLDTFGYVPLFLYPIKLGLIGILAIVTLYLLSKKSEFQTRDLTAISISALFLILFTIVISMLQMQYVSTFVFNPNSWLSEAIRSNILSFRAERMFEIFKIPLAIVASVALGKFVLSKIDSKGSLPVDSSL